MTTNWLIICSFASLLPAWLLSPDADIPSLSDIGPKDGGYGDVGSQSLSANTADGGEVAASAGSCDNST